MGINGVTLKGKGQSVNIEDGRLDFYNAAPIQNLKTELEQHIVKDLEPVMGWSPYTHLLTFEDVVWGILVTERDAQK